MKNKNEGIIKRGTVYTLQRGVLSWRHFIVLENTPLSSQYIQGVQIFVSTEASTIPYWDFKESQFRLYQQGKYIRSSNPKKSRRLLEEEVEELSDKFITTAARIIKDHGKDWQNKQFWEGTQFYRDLF